MIKKTVSKTSNLIVLTCFLALSVTFISCSEKSDTSVSRAEFSTAGPYAEISIKEGGEWQKDSNGHNEYIDGSFTNVEDMTVPAEHTDHTGHSRSWTTLYPKRELRLELHCYIWSTDIG